MGGYFQLPLDVCHLHVSSLTPFFLTQSREFHVGKYCSDPFERVRLHKCGIEIRNLNSFILSSPHGSFVVCLPFSRLNRVILTLYPGCLSQKAE